MPWERLHHFHVLFWLGCLTMSACDSNSAPPSRTDPASREARSEVLERKSLARIPPESPAEVRGEVPADVMDRVRAHLADRVGAAPASFGVVTAEAREWPNGAMGCPQPGINYTQAVVPGYRVVLSHQGRDHDYRVARSGHFVLCEGMHLDQPPAR